MKQLTFLWEIFKLTQPLNCDSITWGGLSKGKNRFNQHCSVDMLVVFRGVNSFCSLRPTFCTCLLAYHTIINKSRYGISPQSGGILCLSRHAFSKKYSWTSQSSQSSSLSLVSIRQKAIATAKHDMIQRASVKRSCGGYGMKTKEVADVGQESQIALPKDRKIM